MVVYKISDSNLKILDSYKVSKKDFEKELNDIKSAEPDYAIWARSISGMKKEWATHNWCYRHGIKPSSTKDVDLNYPQKWYERIAYACVGTIVWPFIK